VNQVELLFVAKTVAPTAAHMAKIEISGMAPVTVITASTDIREAGT